MAIIGKEKYTPEKADKIYQYLVMYKNMEQPIDYEILVDGFKAVRRTDNPEMFHLFENFVNAGTRSVEILMFTGTSNYNDKHILSFEDEIRDTRDKGLSGIQNEKSIQEQIATATDEKLAKAQKDWEYKQLEKELKEWKDHAKELEEENDNLEKELQEIKNAQSPLNDLLGGFGSSLVSGLIRQNPGITRRIPGLAGLLETDDPDLKNSESEQSVSFTPKQEEDGDTKNALNFIRYIRLKLNEEQFGQALKVIDLMSDDPQSITGILNQLQNKGGEDVQI